jgi:hypothetical protein
MRMQACARDILTPVSGGVPIVAAEDRFEASLKPDRTIAAIAADPPRPRLSRLVGQRGGGGLRKVLEETLPDERRHSTPLYLLLDDISGSSLVAGWAWSQWDLNWLANARAALGHADIEEAFRSREGICAGFVPGSSAFTIKADRTGTPAPDLRNPEDPEGWHAMAAQEGVGMRRARRIDVHLKEVIVIEAAFQDSASTPSGGRAVVHEYTLEAAADPVSWRILSIGATPRVLPFVECPAAVDNLKSLIGTPLPALRHEVLARLRGTLGCTHLNDAIRALADVPKLVADLHEAQRLEPRGAGRP